MLAISAVPRGRNQYFVFASRKRGKYIFSWNHDRVLSLAILMRESQPNNWDFPKDVGAIIRDGTLKKTKIGQQFAAKLGSLFAADGENNAGPLQKMASGLLNCLLKGPESARVAVDVLLHAATVNNIISKIDSYPFANEVSFVFFFRSFAPFFSCSFLHLQNNTAASKKKRTRCRYENSFDFSPTSAASRSFSTFVSCHSSGTPSKCKKRKAAAHELQAKDALFDIDENHGPKRFRRNPVVFPPTNFLHTLADAAVGNRDSARASCRHVSFVTPSSPAPAPSAVAPPVGHKAPQKPARAGESALSLEMHREYFVKKQHIDIADGQLYYYRSCRHEDTLQLCHLFALGLSLLVRGTPLCPCHNEPLLCVVRAPFKCPFNQEETAKKRAAAHASKQSANKPGEKNSLTCFEIL